jgi:hypothetical protein
MANPVNIAPDLQAEIERRRNQSFLEQTTEDENRKREELARVDAILGDYARRANLSNNIQGLIPTPGAKISARNVAPMKQTVPGGFNPASLAVVAPFMKRIRKQLKEAERDSGKSFDLNTRKDPDTVEVPGITQKVKNARAKTYGDWNPETQQLHRMQYEDSPEFISYPSRGSIFTTPNRTPSDYRNTNGPSHGQEGGDKAVIHNQKFRNPLILRRDSGEYMADAGLDALFGADWSNNRHQLKSGTRVKTRREKIPIDGPATPISPVDKWYDNKVVIEKPASLQYFLNKVNKNKENPEYHAIYEDLMNTMLQNVMDNTKFKGDTLSAMVERVLPLAKSNISRVQNPQKDYKKYGGNPDFYGTHERWLSEAARKAGYDGILGLRKKEGKLQEHYIQDKFDGPASDLNSADYLKQLVKKGQLTPEDLAFNFRKGTHGAGDYYGAGARKKEPRYRAAQMMLLDPVDKIWNAWESAQERGKNKGKYKITNKIPNTTIYPGEVKNYSPAEIEEKLNYYSSWVNPPRSTFSIQKEIDNKAVQQYFLEGLKNRGIKPRSDIGQMAERKPEINTKLSDDFLKKNAQKKLEMEKQMQKAKEEEADWDDVPSVKEMVKAKTTEKEKQAKAAKAKEIEDYKQQLLNEAQGKPGVNLTPFDKILADFLGEKTPNLSNVKSGTIKNDDFIVDPKPKINKSQKEIYNETYGKPSKDELKILDELVEEMLHGQFTPNK